MNLISKIYHKIICSDKSFAMKNGEVEESIYKILEVYEDNQLLNKKETIEELLYSIALASEERGFFLGVKFIITILEEIHMEQ